MDMGENDKALADLANGIHIVLQLIEQDKKSRGGLSFKPSLTRWARQFYQTRSALHKHMGNEGQAADDLQTLERLENSNEN